MQQHLPGFLNQDRGQLAPEAQSLCSPEDLLEDSGSEPPMGCEVAWCLCPIPKETGKVQLSGLGLLPATWEAVHPAADVRESHPCLRR